VYIKYTSKNEHSPCQTELQHNVSTTVTCHSIETVLLILYWKELQLCFISRISNLSISFTLNLKMSNMQVLRFSQGWRFKLGSSELWCCVVYWHFEEHYCLHLPPKHWYPTTTLHNFTQFYISVNL